MSTPPAEHPVATPVSEWDDFGFDTRQVHAGEYEDRNWGSRVPPVYLSAGYRLDSFDDSRAKFAGEVEGHIYARHQSPTNGVAERRVASLEGGVEALSVASGHAAVTVSLLALAGAGDHIISHANIYSGTRTLFARTFAKLGIEVEYVWTEDPAEWATLVRPNTKAVFIESIPNPKNDILDIAAFATFAHHNGLPLVVDNTVASPYLIRPIEFGADVVVHSSTKFLSGHGAGLSGIVVDAGRFDWAADDSRFPAIGARPFAEIPSLVERFGPSAYAHLVRDQLVNDLGPTLAPLNGFLLQQGIETLSVRLERHLSSASTIAAWLDAHAAVQRVDHASVPSHPNHERALAITGGHAGSVFSFSVHGGIDNARRVVDALRVFSRMTHIGDTRSMVLHPATTTHASFTQELRDRLGVDDGLIRLSIGLETVVDLIADLEQALSRAV